LEALGLLLLLLLGLLGRSSREASVLLLELWRGEPGGLGLKLRVTEWRRLAGETGRLGSKSSWLLSESRRLRLLN
jgi:hypothetical protein